MGNHPDIDETIVLDFSLCRRELVRHLARDGEYCDQDARVVRLFDAPHQELSRVTRVRRATETALRCGLSRYSRGVCAAAGITFITAGQVVSNVVQLPLGTQKRPNHGNGPDAA